MTEPDPKDDLKFLDGLDETAKKPGYSKTIVIGLIIVGLGIGSTLLWGSTKGSAEKPKESSGDPKNSKNDNQYPDITNFADKFAIMAFNVSYTDISHHQVDKVVNLMSDDMMSDYQEAFLDSKWVSFLTDNKAYVSYQQIERSTVENTDGTHYWVRVIGKNLFNSDSKGPGSQIELPFELVVVVKNDNGKLVVTDFQRL